MLLGVVTALVIPVNVKAVDIDRSNITEADLDENSINTLNCDVTLTIEHDKIIDAIDLNNHDLTINGTGTLTVNGFIDDRSGNYLGSLTIDSGNLEVYSPGPYQVAICVRNFTINGGSVRATTDASSVFAILAYEHINIASSLKIMKPSGGRVLNYDDGQGNHADVIVDSDDYYALDVLIAEPDGDHEKKSKHKKVTTASYDCYYTEVDGQIVYGGLIEDVFAQIPASMIPDSAYTKFNEFMAKKIKGAEAGAAISVNAEPWISINDKFANAFTEKGDVALTITYRFKDVLYQVTIPAGMNLSELLDENRCIGLARLGSLYGAEPVVETVETEE